MTGLCDLPMELLLTIYSHIPTPYSGKFILDKLNRAGFNSPAVAHDILEDIRRGRAGLLNLGLTCKRLSTLPLESTWRETNFGLYAKDSQDAIVSMIAFLQNIREHPAQFSTIRKLFIYVDEDFATSAVIPEDSQDFVIQAAQSIGFYHERIVPGNRWRSLFQLSNAIKGKDSEPLMGALLLTIILHLPCVDDMAFNVSPRVWKYLQELYHCCMDSRLVVSSPNLDNDGAGTRDVKVDGSDAEQNAPALRPTGHRLQYTPLNTVRSFSFRNPQRAQRHDWVMCNRAYDCIFPLAPGAEVYCHGYDRSEACIMDHCKDLSGKLTPNLTSIVLVKMLMSPEALRQTLSDCRQLTKFIYMAQGETGHSSRDLTTGDVIEALEVHATTLRTICVDCRSKNKVHPIKSLEKFTALENLWLHVDSFFEFEESASVDPETHMYGIFQVPPSGIIPICRQIREKLRLAAAKKEFAGGNDSRRSDYEMTHPAFLNLPASLKKFHLSGPVRFLLSDFVSMWEKHAGQDPSQRLPNVLAIDLATQCSPTKNLLKWVNFYGFDPKFEIDPLPHLW
ncbi:hypothetical protein CcaCcLH18_09159 [Colletotrichum camelliae]|nr:hypothetical protein CcaCcLH18_09159 [Colletotrichum camelliae]